MRFDLRSTGSILKTPCSYGIWQSGWRAGARVERWMDGRALEAFCSTPTSSAFAGHSQNATALHAIGPGGGVAWLTDSECRSGDEV
jgi:hypothetical protein